MTQEQKTAMYDQPEPLPVPEPALKAALLEDTKTLPGPTNPDYDARAVLRDYLAGLLDDRTGITEPLLEEDEVDNILAAVDRYVDSLPQAQVEYVSAPLMDGMRGEALNHAVGIAKVSTNLGNMEATDTAGIVAQAEAFHAFLTGSTERTTTTVEIGGQAMTEQQFNAARFPLQSDADAGLPGLASQGFAEDDDITRHAEKQGCSCSDAWAYFVELGCDMSHASPQHQ